MLLHIGGDYACSAARVLAILDMPSCGGSRDTRDVLRRAHTQGMLQRVGEEKPRAAVLVQESDGRVRIVLTPISAMALRGRLANTDSAYASAQQ